MRSRRALKNKKKDFQAAGTWSWVETRQCGKELGAPGRVNWCKSKRTLPA